MGDECLLSCQCVHAKQLAGADWFLDSRAPPSPSRACLTTYSSMRFARLYHVSPDCTTGCLTHSCDLCLTNTWCLYLCLWSVSNQSAVYSATHAFVHRDLKELGISATLVDIDTHPDTWTPLLQPTTKVGMR